MYADITQENNLTHTK